MNIMRFCPICAQTFPDEVLRCEKDGVPLRAKTDPCIGKVIRGEYQLLSTLGTGGMSNVYLAKRLKGNENELYALKVLRHDLARNAGQRDRFIREARAVNRVQHENIVTLYDFGETADGLVYLVMEHVPGEPLYKLLHNGPMNCAQALDIAAQVTSALAKMHQMGVVHRDLKPDNILLVARPGRPLLAKVVDFGIAKILDAPSLTASQHIFGTPGYIAPEYIQSTHIDGRADFYSLGVILYEMITGSLPFDYEYPADLLAKHLQESPVAPSQRVPSLEPMVEEVILKCLQKNPKQRFQDALALLRELRILQALVGPAPLQEHDSAHSIKPLAKCRTETPIQEPEMLRNLVQAASKTTGPIKFDTQAWNMAANSDTLEEDLTRIPTINCLRSDEPFSAETDWRIATGAAQQRLPQTVRRF